MSAELEAPAVFERWRTRNDGDDQKQKPRSWTGARIGQFILGVVLFGILMGIRGEFASIWARTLVAACAGAILAIFVLPLRKNGR